MDKKIVTDIDSEIILLSPYDKIIYRFIEELTINSLKYSDDGEIEFKLSLENGVIIISVKNKIKSSFEGKQKQGFGLKNIQKQVDILNGMMDIIRTDMFLVNIRIPIDEELCYENFTN